MLPGANHSRTPPKKDDVTNRLINRFQQLMSQGLLAPGTKLPPERDLARRFGVSRSSLRHALKILESMGVLMQRVGDGTYLREASLDILTRPLEMLILMDGISASELLETRLIVEPELAARAAERAGSADLETLRQAIEDMEKGQADQARMIDTDIAFHRAIFQASGNRLSQRIFPLIHRAMLSSIAITSELVDWNHTLAYHKPIYAAIYRRKPAEARQRMIEHLKDARNLLARAGAQRQSAKLLDLITPIA